MWFLAMAYSEGISGLSPLVPRIMPRQVIILTCGVFPVKNDISENSEDNFKGCRSFFVTSLYLLLVKEVYF